MYLGRFEITFMFPDDYSDMIAEITYDGKFVCLITQEKGYSKMRIEIANNEYDPKWDLN